MNKRSNRKLLVGMYAIVVLAVTVGLSAMLSGKSENDNLQILTEEDTVEEKSYAYLKSAKVGDIVEFGSYNGFTTWRVLAKDDTNLMLITENVVDMQPLNKENEECNWSRCTLRTWLNTDYYNSAFSDEEKMIIKESDIDGGKDKVFLLSSDEARKYFASDSDRIAHNSEYEKEYSIKVPYGYWWWLRSPVHGYDDNYFGSGVHNDGVIYEGFINVYYDDYGIRPAINIDISD